MQIAICEDNANEQERLVNAINDWANDRKIKVNILTYSSAEAFLFVWDDIVFDLIFLDIKMKKMSGIELAKYIRKKDKNISIVFVTSFTQYVLSGYDINALHYLIKPVSKSKLMPIMDKALIISRSHRKDGIVVTNGLGLHKVLFGNILYISMKSHTAQIHTENSTIYEMRKTVSELELLLPSYFVRNHRSYIVNLLKTVCVYKDYLILFNEETLPISRNKTKIVNDAFVRLHME